MTDRPDETAAIQEYLNQDPRAARENFIAEDAVWRHWRWGDHELVGRENIIRQYFERLDEAYDDWSFEVNDVIVDRDTLVVRGRFRGTFRSDFHGVGATGKPVSWRAHDIFRFRDGKIVEAWFANDTYVVAREMGVISEDAPWPWRLPEADDAATGD